MSIHTIYIQYTPLSLLFERNLKFEPFGQGEPQPDPYTLKYQVGIGGYVGTY
jgi:hypothetical protein